MAKETNIATTGKVVSVNSANFRPSAYQRKKERERQQIIERMNNAPAPQFGLKSTTHDLFGSSSGRQERDSGIAELPDGARIEINEHVSLVGKDTQYSVTYWDSKGHQDNSRLKRPKYIYFKREKAAVREQKRAYEAEMARIKKKYNID